MNDYDKLAAAVEEHCRKNRWEEISSQRDGAIMLEDLLRMLDGAKEFRRRHEDLVFDMSPTGEERAVQMRYRGVLVAKWTRDGTTLRMFSPPNRQKVVIEVKTTRDAFAYTVGYVANVLPKLPADWPPKAPAPKQASPPTPSKIGFLG